MADTEALELIAAVDDVAGQLMDEHKARRDHWYFHEFVPWEQGRNYVDEPWSESDGTLDPTVRTSLVLNLLTEDNLPYYHSIIERHMPKDSKLAEWNKLWTAEEGQHAIALRSYLLTSRNCDPKALEDDRYATMLKGYEAEFKNPIDLFAYTSAQELATRVSHRNAGKLADDETAYAIMARIAADENHHFMFYRGVTTAMLNEHPSAVVTAIYRVLNSFQMPGTGIPGFARRAVEMARAGVYSLRLHRDRVVMPLLRDWAIADVEGLDAEGREARDKLMALPDKLLRGAEVFEKRFGVSTA